MLTIGSLVSGYAPTTVGRSAVNAQMGLLDAVSGLFGEKKQVFGVQKSPFWCLVSPWSIPACCAQWIQRGQQLNCVRTGPTLDLKHASTRVKHADQRFGQ